MPLTAFAPDINGVWSVGGTRPISSTPRNVESVKMTIAMISASVVMKDSPTGCSSDLAGVDQTHRPGDLVVHADHQLAFLGEEVLQERQDVAAQHLAGVQRHRGRQVHRAEDR